MSLRARSFSRMSVCIPSLNQIVLTLYIQKMHKVFLFQWQCVSNPSTCQEHGFTEVFLKATGQLTRQEPSGTRQDARKLNAARPGQVTFRACSIRLRISCETAARTAAWLAWSDQKRGFDEIAARKA